MSFCKQCGVLDKLDGPTNDPRRRLVEVDDEILLLEAQISKRLEQRQALKRQINAQFSPLLQLPLDLLAEISLAAFPKNNVDAWDDATPLLLGSICRAWRDVAWAMPGLWCTVPLDVFRRYQPSIVFLLQEWLSRSRQLPVSISLDLADPTEPYEDDIMWGIMDVVARCSERWQQVDFNIPNFFEESYCYIPRSFPQLRTLRIHSFPEDFPEIIDIFQHAPVLSEVSLDYYHGILLPTKAILCLALKSVNTQDCLELIKRHPNLTKCAFISISPSVPGAFNNSIKKPGAVEASSLESLNLAFPHKNQHDVPLVLDNLSVPSLQDFGLIINQSTFPKDILVSFVQRSSCQLVRLAIYNNLMVNAAEKQLVELLTILPLLKELKLGEIKYGTHISSKLTCNPNDDPSSTPFLPNLIRLSLTLDVKNKFNFSVLLKMVRSRRYTTRDKAGGCSENKPNRVTQMEAITMWTVNKHSGNSPTEADLAQFQELEDEGMEVSLMVRDRSLSREDKVLWWS
ncbi:hypothetical protein BDZ94DRAFT_1248301 [Collybia nuda]|uniref:F-box domain-containing protein n=1 Tax=Collybia nuda TaxID=64659 RepID=A0A9P5YEQ3_9AGAR|nr:hypothetical protein BDZ94DRAFT_1248301 [Collybia nuda]